MRTVFARGAAAALLFACSAPDAGSLSGPVEQAPPPAIVSLRVDPPSAASAVTLGSTSSIAFRAFAARDGEPEVDVTGDASWTIDGSHVADVTGPGRLTTVGVGGRAKVTATLAGASASAPIAVKLTGDVFLDGAGASARDAFAAPLDASTPIALEYPPSGVVVPANVAPLEVQWTAAGTDALFRLRVTSDDVLDLTLYTTHRELAAPADIWAKIGASSPDQPIAMTVEGVDASSKRHASESRAVTITAERIEQSAIYMHYGDAPGKGGLAVVDLAAATEAPIVTDSPPNQPGQCAGCHVVSRDGRRIGFATASADGYLLGALRHDPSRSLFAETIAAGSAGRAPNVTFNPLESTTRPAMLAAYYIPSQAIAGLVLLDPDTGKSIPSDLAQMLAAVPASAGRGAGMPSWSSHGDSVVFSSFPNDGNPAMQPAQGLPQGSLVEASVSFEGGAFHFGAPTVIVPVASGESNLRPSFDDDDETLAFMRVSAVGAHTAIGRVLLLRRSDGRVIPLDAGKADEQGAWETRLPDWGPAGPPGSKYAWIVASSSRPYGHRVAAMQHMQLWIFAVDRQKLASGDGDPSVPAFWVPGQSVVKDYMHPQWPRVKLSK